MDDNEKQWKKKLTQEQYYVLREGGTERPFSDTNLYKNAEGVYCCAACDAPLFDSQSKYDSGTGWPSFYEPFTQSSVSYYEDYKLGGLRVEVRCKNCDSHLGHVFEDGPKPTGKRYCMNSVALKFKSTKTEDESHGPST